jgi:murein DD-endopeptidase MepM/ murein hydrolase activator NlpD
MIKILTVLMLLFSYQAPAPEIIAKPVPFSTNSVKDHFVAPLWTFGPGHRGIDLAIDPATPIASPFDGSVFFVGKVVNRMSVTVLSTSGLKASFEPVCGIVSQGHAVRQNQTIGFLCEGDESYQTHCASCLHFSIRNDHGYLNPLLFYGLLTPPRLVG